MRTHAHMHTRTLAHMHTRTLACTPCSTTARGHTRPYRRRGHTEHVNHWDAEPLSAATPFLCPSTHHAPSSFRCRRNRERSSHCRHQPSVELGHQPSVEPVTAVWGHRRDSRGPARQAPSAATSAGVPEPRRSDAPCKGCCAMMGSGDWPPCGRVVAVAAGGGC